MDRNNAAIIAALRRKAADKSVTAEEAKLLSAKADELAKKYGIVESHRFQEEKTYEFTFTPKPDPKEPWIPTTRGYYFVYTVSTYANWLSDIEEDSSRNDWSEFPQEEGIG